MAEDSIVGIVLVNPKNHILVCREKNSVQANILPKWGFPKGWSNQGSDINIAIQKLKKETGINLDEMKKDWELKTSFEFIRNNPQENVKNIYYIIQINKEVTPKPNKEFITKAEWITKKNLSKRNCNLGVNMYLKSF